MQAHLLPKLRCYFAEFLNQSSLKRLGLLDPPTCVGLRYGPHALNLEAFLGSVESMTSDDKVSASRLGLEERRICLPLKPTRLHQHPTAGSPILLRPPIAHAYGYRNINLFSIGYASRPRLRSRLTLGRLALPRKPRAYGEEVSHFFCRYSCQHDHFSLVQRGLRHTFIPSENAPLPSSKLLPKLRYYA